MGIICTAFYSSQFVLADQGQAPSETPTIIQGTVKMKISSEKNKKNSKSTGTLKKDQKKKLLPSKIPLIKPMEEKEPTPVTYFEEAPENPTPYSDSEGLTQKIYKSGNYTGTNQVLQVVPENPVTYK